MNDLLAALLSWATTLSGHPAPDVSVQTVSVSPAAIVQRAPGGREGNSHRAERTIAHEVDFGVSARACPANVAAREEVEQHDGEFDSEDIAQWVAQAPPYGTYIDEHRHTTSWLPGTLVRPSWMSPGSFERDPIE